LAAVSVTKCQATGNDFILLDRRAGSSARYPELARFLCDRRLGVGGDGLLVLSVPADSDSDAALRIFNADGSEAQMCANGVRCVARYVSERWARSAGRLRLATNAGIVNCQSGQCDGAWRVEVAIGEPTLGALAPSPLQGCSFRRVSVGNEHVVAFVESDLAQLDLADVARRVNAGAPPEYAANVEIARAGRGGFEMRVWERGVGETMACGTGACAVAACAIAGGLARSPVTLSMRGGRVDVVWDGPGCLATLIGDAQIVFDADVALPEDPALA